ncbi:MAG: hypothetical protein LBR69_06345 [Endomicrobium sp.]|jgi:hypothetical protein|nr:hypothetical protein [Endomicrobium sp.]
MRKFIVLVLSICVFANAAFAYGGRNYEEFNEYRSKYRILYGLLLVVGGGFLAYDGFRTVKIDISKPAVSFTASGMWNYTPFGGVERVLNAKGTITNTGNVTLKQLTFEVRYRSTGYQSGFYYPAPDYRGNPTGFPVDFTGIGSILYTSEVGQINNWENHSFYSRMDANGNDPFGSPDPYWSDDGSLVEIVNVNYTWDKKYKEEMNNVYEGLAGVVLFGAGVYVLVDYIVSLNRFNYYMKKHGMDIYVENNYDEFQLKMSKRI